MSRLCERPGCSEPGAVAYGMIPENLLFWIAPIKEAPVDDPPVLCRRHADQMSVPRGWTLDDRRERFPRLFMPRPVSGAGIAPAVVAHPHHATRRRRSRSEHEPEQLVIDGTGEIPRPVPAVDGEPSLEGVPHTVAVSDAGPESVASISDTGLVPIIEPDPEMCFDLDAVAAHEAALPELIAEPAPNPDTEPGWTPEFDVDDTLNGLLKPKSPLLARAFRGTSRRR